MGDLSEMEVFAGELRHAICNDPWIRDRERIGNAIQLALQITISRRAQSEDASRKRGE